MGGGLFLVITGRGCSLQHGDQKREVENLIIASHLRIWRWGKTGSEPSADSIGVSRERPGGVPDTRPTVPTVLFFCLFKILFLKTNSR